MLTDLHKRLLNDFQSDFPLSERPYRDIAQAIGVSEDDVLSALNELNEQNLISRIGPIISPNRIGVSTLVAMAVPERDIEWVAERISRHAEVNHNYEREHRLNLWFVAIARDERHLSGLLKSIEQETGYQTLQLPMLDDFFIDLGFKLDLSHA